MLGVRHVRCLARLLWLPLILCAGCSASFAFADEPLHARIDQLIAAKADGPLAAMASDEEFLSRVYLDFAGRIPSVSETRAFLADSEPEKREKLIDKLQASDEFPRRMTELFTVMLIERLGDHEEWTRFLRESFRANKPWDQMAREIIYPNAEDESQRGAAFFFSKRLENYGQNPVDYPGLVRDVGRLFLGVDVQCAQCHDHLFVSDYKQEDYQGLFAFVGHATLRNDVKFPAVAEKLVTEKVAFKSVFVQVEKMTGPRLPHGTEIEIPTLAKGEEYAIPPDRKNKFPGVPTFSPLKILSEQLPRADNKLFPRNMANRLWWVLMGRGLVHPLDLHHKDNSPSHPALLDLVAGEFVAQHFDMKWLLREIALSATYQRSSVQPEGVESVTPQSFRAFLEKPLSAEQLLYSVVQATGAADPIPTTDDKTAEASPAATPASKDLRDRFAKAFANPPREPEVEHTPTLKAALFLMNDAEVLGRLKSQSGNLVARLAAHSDLNQLAEELYLAVLTRKPSDNERAEVVSYLRSRGDRKEQALGYLVWSLLASSEFCMNH